MDIANNKSIQKIENESNSEDLSTLRTRIKSSGDITKLNAVDAAKYFAEWWSDLYDGGTPSIDRVYESLKDKPNDQLKFSKEDFFKASKKGLKLQRIQCIQGNSNNQLWFRTLLSQGGLPLHYLFNNEHDYNRYINFLRSIIDNEITNISVLIDYKEITNLLPLSSRNEAFYDSCIRIVEAINAGNHDYLALFERKGGDRFKKLKDELIEHSKQNNQVAKQIKFRGHWFLQKVNNDNNNIYLEFSHPNIISKGDFSEISGIGIEDLKVRYYLFANDEKVFEFRKNMNGDYLVTAGNQSIKWDGKSIKPELYLLSKDSKHNFELPILTVDYPDLSEPTLWIQKEENKWKLHKGKNYHEDQEVMVVFNENWKCQTDIISISNIKIQGTEFNYIYFKGSTSFKNNDNTEYTYKTNTSSFDISVIGAIPLWLISANMPIVRMQQPIIHCYNKDGDRINDVKLQWYNGVFWNDKYENSLGFNKFKASQNNITEDGKFYNIGDLEFEFESENLFESKIIINKNNGFIIEVADNDFIASEINENCIVLKINEDHKKFPKSIRLEISMSGQYRKLLLEINPPFQGALITDPEGNILDQSKLIILEKFAGYRLFSKSNFDFNFIEFFNHKFDSIKYRTPISEVANPLINYEDKIKSLFMLSSPMDKESCVKIRLINVRHPQLTEYTVKNHNTLLNYTSESDLFKMELKNTNNETVSDLNLWCIPLDCAAANVDLFPINMIEDHFVFDESIFSLFNKFIVFSDSVLDSKNQLLPSFVNRGIQEDYVPKGKRISKNIDDLRDNFENSWSKALKYYKLCNENKLPYSTFDVLSAGFSTPDLASKMICLFIAESEQSQMIGNIKDIEEDLGISFHWIGQKHWKDAFDWLHSFNSNRYSNELIDQLKPIVLNLIKNNLKYELQPIAEYSLSNVQLNNINLPANMQTKDLRKRLGQAVINELPSVNLTIDNNYLNVFSFNNFAQNLQFILQSPLKVALSITGEDESLWGFGDDKDKIRRNIQYVCDLDPIWHSRAVLYFIQKLSGN